MRSWRSAATKVRVFQWPCGTCAVRRPVAAAAQGLHVGLHPRFVDENQALRIDAGLASLPPRSLAGDIGAQLTSICGERAGFICAVLWSTYPFNLWLVKQPNSEVPFILVFLLALGLFLLGVSGARWSSFVFSGLLLGVAALIRPIALFVPFVLAVVFLFYRSQPLLRRLLCGALIVTGFFVAILPWELELKTHLGNFAPLSTGGPPTIATGLTFPTKFFLHQRGRARVPERVTALAENIEQQQASLQTTSGIAGVMISELHRDPRAVFELGALKIARSWYGDDSMLHEDAIGLIQLLYVVLALPGIWLAWRNFPSQRYQMSVLLILVLYFWGMTIVALSILRYMIPVMTLVVMFGAVSLDAVLRFSRAPAQYRAPSVQLLDLGRRP